MENYPWTPKHLVYTTNMNDDHITFYDTSVILRNISVVFCVFMLLKFE